MPTYPNVQQGRLNRARSSVVIPAFPNLNVLSSYMSKSFVSAKPEGDFAELIPTATGAVPSPEPFVFMIITIGLLRTQSLGEIWQEQAEVNSFIGDITVHSDTSAFLQRTYYDCVISKIDPEAYDGRNPENRLTIRGIYRINNAMWNLA